MTQGPVDLQVSLSYGLPRKGIPAPSSFRRWVAAALDRRCKAADIGIRIVDAEEGQHFNRHYRGKDYATNVLSFEADRPEGLPDDVHIPLIGDLILCAPVVEREATSAHHSAPPPAGTRPGGSGRATERPDPHGP